MDLSAVFLSFSSFLEGGKGKIWLRTQIQEIGAMLQTTNAVNLLKHFLI